MMMLMKSLEKLARLLQSLECNSALPLLSGKEKLKWMLLLIGSNLVVFFYYFLNRANLV